jgi:hypothetical protein
LEAVNAPQQDPKKKSFIPSGKNKSNRVMTYSIGFVSGILNGSTMELSSDQIQRLEAQGNRSTNWSGIKLTAGSSHSYENSLDRIRNCFFSGTIYIGVLVKHTTLEHGISMPCGLYNSNFSGNCIFSDNCLVFNCGMISNVFLGRNSCLMNCGTVVCEGQTSYGTQRSICIGSESDSPGSAQSRSVILNVNMSYSDICARLLLPRNRTNQNVDNNPPGRTSNASINSNSNTNNSSNPNNLAMMIPNTMGGSSGNDMMHNLIMTLDPNNTLLATQMQQQHSLPHHQMQQQTTQGQLQGVYANSGGNSYTGYNTISHQASLQSNQQQTQHNSVPSAAQQSYLAYPQTVVPSLPPIPPPLPPQQQQGVRRYTRSNRNDDYIRYDMTIICDDVELIHCATIVNVFIGSYCKLHNNGTLNNSTMLSHCSVSSSELTDCVLHGSCTISGHSLVNGVIMFPHSSISQSAKVSECVLGPDSSVSVGEAKRSILGPHVGFHHTSLLIASMWPLGRGNIGYGAMIGANHTSRSNDMECFPGEGCFYGLSVAVRFPFSMVQSPYSIIAANTICVSQRIAFPFSLIARNDHVSNFGDESNVCLAVLRPAWVLTANAYFVERTLSKFSKRRKSMDYRTDFPIFRPSIAELIYDARMRIVQLKRLVNEERESVVDEAGYLKNLAAYGGGKCLVAVKDLDRAFESYTLFLQRYALHVSESI